MLHIIRSMSPLCVCASRCRHVFTRISRSCKVTRRQASAHCLRFDPLWYNAYDIGLSQIDFTISVIVYRQQVEMAVPTIFHS